MDGEPEPEREVTRVPTDADLVSLARELNRLRVAYVVVGGFVINRLGFVRATEDIDLLIARDRANQASVRVGVREARDTPERSGACPRPARKSFLAAMTMMRGAVFLLGLAAAAGTGARLPGADAATGRAVEAASAADVSAARRLNDAARRQRNTDLAQAGATAAGALVEARRSGDRREEFEALALLASLGRLRGDYPASFRYAREGLDLAIAAKDEKRRAEFLSTLGIAYWSVGDFTKALEQHVQVHQIAEKLEDRFTLATAFANLATVHRSIGNHDAEMDFGLKSVAVLEELGADGPLAMALNNVGNAHRARSEPERARDYYERSLALKLKVGDKRSIAASYVNLGGIATDARRHEEALALHRQALALRREVGDTRGIASSLALVAENLTALGREAEALVALQEAVPIADRLGSPELRFNVHSRLSETLRALGNPAEALTALRTAIEAREKQLNEQVQRRVVEMQTRFDVERKEAEIDLLKRDQALRAAELHAKESELQAAADREARQRLQRNALLGSLALGAIAVGALVSRHNLKRRAAQKIIAETRAAKEAAEQANALKTRLLGVASHDLKEPLGAMINIAGALRCAPPGAPPPAEIAGWIEGESRRLFNLVLDLVDTAALEVGKLELNRAPCDLAGLVRALVVEFEVRAAPKEQRVTFTVTPAPDSAYLLNGDAARLRQVIGNVLGNALKFTPPRRSVHVWLEADGGAVRCRVRDEGPGLKPEELSKLFHSFQRLSAQPTGGESSTGLGLSIAHEIVTLHGGRIWAESPPGEGATFVIEVPAAVAVERGGQTAARGVWGESCNRASGI